MNKLIFTLIFLFNQLSFANCKEPVTYLKQGDTSVCTGYLFSPEKELEVRTKVIELEKTKTLVTQQDELIKVLNQRVDINLRINQNLRKQVDELEETQNLERIVYFSLGVLLGLGVGKALTK